MHLGLVTFEHAKSCGVDRQAWNRALAHRTVEQMHRDVIRMFGTASTVDQRILAAVLAAGPGAVASHRSSAHMWGVDRPSSDPIDIILPLRSRRSRVQNVVVHRPRVLVALQPVFRGSVPTTNPLRTLLDLGAVDGEGVGKALRSFILAGFVTPGAVAAALIRHAQRGRAGIGPLRNALECWNIDAKPADSELEIQMSAIRDRFGLPSMEFHALISGYEVDFAITGTPLIVECDGWSTHGIDQQQFETDRQRDADLSACGHVVLRMTSRALFRSPGIVAQRVAQNLWAWAPEVAETYLSGHPDSILGATRPH